MPGTRNEARTLRGIETWSRPPTWRRRIRGLAKRSGPFGGLTRLLQKLDRFSLPAQGADRAQPRAEAEGRCPGWRRCPGLNSPDLLGRAGRPSHQLLSIPREITFSIKNGLPVWFYLSHETRKEVRIFGGLRHPVVVVGQLAFVLVLAMRSGPSQIETARNSSNVR
jgi:hypothetical protein